MSFLFNHSINFLVRDDNQQTYNKEDGGSSRAAYIQTNEGVGDSFASVI
jgi:hypothetical protein